MVGCSFNTITPIQTMETKDNQAISKPSNSIKDTDHTKPPRKTWSCWTYDNRYPIIIATVIITNLLLYSIVSLSKTTLKPLKIAGLIIVTSLFIIISLLLYIKLQHKQHQLQEQLSYQIEQELLSGKTIHTIFKQYIQLALSTHPNSKQTFQLALYILQSKKIKNATHQENESPATIITTQTINKNNQIKAKAKKLTAALIDQDRNEATAPNADQSDPPTTPPQPSIDRDNNPW